MSPSENKSFNLPILLLHHRIKPALGKPGRKSRLFGMGVQIDVNLIPID